MDLTIDRCHIEGCSLVPEPNVPTNGTLKLGRLTQPMAAAPNLCSGTKRAQIQQPDPN